MNWRNPKFWFIFSIIFLVLSLIISPQEGSVLEAIAPASSTNQIYRWSLPAFFFLSTLYWLVKISRGMR